MGKNIGHQNIKHVQNDALDRFSLHHSGVLDFLYFFRAQD